MIRGNQRLMTVIIRPWLALNHAQRIALLQGFMAYLTIALLIVGINWLAANVAQPLTLAPASVSRWLMVGLNQVEPSEFGDFRWTTGESRLCVEGVGYAPRSLVSVRLAGAYARSLGTETVTLIAGRAVPVTVALAPELRRYTLLTGVDQQSATHVCLTIQSNAVRDPNNPRWLGVPFYGLKVQPLPAAALVIPDPISLAIGLALALGWLTILHLSGVPLLVAMTMVAVGIGLVGYSLISGLVPFGVGTLRWALPTVVGIWLGGAGLLVTRSRRLRQNRFNDLLVTLYWGLVILGAFWLLQQISGHRGVWPLKSRIDLSFTWWVFIPIALAIGWFAIGLRWLTRPLSVGLVVIYTLGGALALPVLFDITVHGVDAPIALFRDSPYEYLRDTPQVAGDPLRFLANFETIAPGLSVHGSTHPPGAILFLWLIEQMFGPGAVAASWITIGLTAFIPLVAVWLGWQIGGSRLALAAGMLAVVLPGQMIYGVTSLDGVFSLFIAAGAAAFFLALEPPYRVWLAVVAGLCIAAALFMTYATTQLFFFGVAAASFAIVRYIPHMGWRTVLAGVIRQGAITAGIIIGIYLMLFVVTDFNVISAARTATQINGEMMGRFREYGPPPTPFLPPSYDYYLRFAAANLVSYLTFLTPWVLAALSSLYVKAGTVGWRPLWAALLGSLGVLVLGMWLSGLFNREVERIWMFTYPFVSVLVACQLGDGSVTQLRRRLIVYLGLTLAFFVIMKLTLYTSW